MTITSNIHKVIGQSAGNGPPNVAQGQSQPGGLLGFLEAIIQQLNASSSQATPSLTTQNVAPDVKSFADKIADLLKKNGVSADDLKNMSPQDLAAKIAGLLQQQGAAIHIPVALQSLTPDDLSTKIASLIQKNDAVPGVKPSLTSDLVSQHAASLQGNQTKDDIAKDISSLLEKQQASAVSTTDPALLKQIQGEFAQLQAAPGSISPDTMNRLTADLGNLLAAQGIDKGTVSDLLGSLAQSLEKNKTVTADNAAQAAGIGDPQSPPALQAALNNNAKTSGANAAAAVNTPPKAAPAVNGRESIFGGAKEGILPQASSQASSQQASVPAAQQQQQAAQPQTDVTAKVSGFSGVNAALINDLANNSGSGSGFGNGFGGDSNAQPQDMTGLAALVHPASADTANNQNFINYMSSTSGASSQTTQMVAVQMQRNISAGLNTMSLQLEPANLGRLDIKLKFDKDGGVKAHMTVDKPETLALLQKDSHHLQRILQQSGLDTDDNSISFDLRQQGEQHNLDGSQGNGRGEELAGQTNDNNADADKLQANIAVQAAGYITRSGVNIMV